MVLYNRWYFSESGYVTAAVYSRDGCHIIVGHSTGLIQMRNGATGAVMCTLRNVQFPPKPVYALEYSRTEARVCYAACMDGTVYRIEIPDISMPSDAPQLCIRADPALECLNMQFYGAPGISAHSTPFINQRSPALSLGLTSDQAKLIVGYADASIKVFDMATQEVDLTYKVHKLRIQFIPKKLQRMHFGQVCALKCHDDRPFVFASAAWDKTLRVWDTRCAIGCMMTFEGVDVCSNSIDINRDHVIAGSWQTTEALSVYDIVAKKRVSVVRVQNRRPDVDGEFIYACQFWKSNQFNRKGKYGIMGGSGTKCVEVINLHNRYITCSYPAEGSVLAITSHEDLIAFGGTAPVFTVVSFHDPKHEKYAGDVEEDYEYNKPTDDVMIYEDADNISIYSTDEGHSYASRKSIVK
ncbi:uncharacterized protein isoform X2 [Choristoneura fumiferana]|uniref:uncharacterized protein isoform X2 n=1 Tax=Choristoneura fumiferana TaxID=7141 RepID=UPI003D1537B2